MTVSDLETTLTRLRKEVAQARSPAYLAQHGQRLAVALLDANIALAAALADSLAPAPAKKKPGATKKAAPAAPAAGVRAKAPSVRVKGLGRGRVT